MGQRQDIDKAIGPVLGHGGVHDDRTGQPVRAGRAQMAAHEHLPAAGQFRRGRDAPAIDHRAGANGLATGQLDAARLHRFDHGAGADCASRQFAPQSGVEILGRQRVVARLKSAGMGRKAHVIALVPAGLAQRCQQVGARSGEVGRKPAPPVIAAQRFTLFQQAQRQIGPRAVQRQRCQPTGQPAAQDRKIMPATIHRAQT